MLPTINPPGFFWPQAELGTDVKVNEWIRQIQREEELKKEKWDVVLFGVPLSRSSISVSGASEFPESFRRSWKGFSTYNLDFECDLQELKVADLGDVKMHFTDIPQCHSNIKQTIKEISKQFPDSFPIAIGGDHSITAMLVSGLKELEPEKEIGILQLDTHLDLRSLEDHGPTNGTPIRNLIQNSMIKGENVYNIGLHGFFNSQSLIKYAKEHKLNYITLKEARRRGIEETVKEALLQLESKVDKIYVTIDMDVLDIGFAPGVPASTPGGMSTEELFSAVYAAGLSPKTAAMDIVCLDPTRDHQAQPTVKAGTYTFLTFLTALMNRR
ncbi:agmatinase family protein [Cytobacillus oceanisediminis]|uniref:agmatinase family protein n=1 Tax=Cytobacillus oceanisediminis TaxID=665099 RepID=UPI001FB4CBD2|nr:agmatinase family protein [Cytobacillus oceanisediminis]UOE52966.1 agmatinase family protein [Cytobacillus oceanisediminis]